MPADRDRGAAKPRKLNFDGFKHLIERPKSSFFKIENDKHGVSWLCTQAALIITWSAQTVMNWPSFQRSRTAAEGFPRYAVTTAFDCSRTATTTMRMYFECN